MTVSVAHLGPPGTYTEQATLAYVSRIMKGMGQEAILRPYPSIAQTLRAVSQSNVDLAVVPVENSIEGGVAITLDMLWQLDTLQIQLALVMPIDHAVLSHAQSLRDIQAVYSHPQALGQCQGWLEQFMPSVQLIPTNSTTEPLQKVEQDWTTGVIASLRAAQIYKIPVLAKAINDYPGNSTRFWVLGQGQSLTNQHLSSHNVHTSLAFSTGANVPGSLVKPLQVFAQRGINLSRLESRPTKRSLGDYVFFVDLEADANSSPAKSALEELASYTEILKLFGSYSVLPVQP